MTSPVKRQKDLHEAFRVSSFIIREGRGGPREEAKEIDENILYASKQQYEEYIRYLKSGRPRR